MRIFGDEPHVGSRRQIESGFGTLRAKDRTAAAEADGDQDRDRSDGARSLAASLIDWGATHLAERSCDNEVGRSSGWTAHRARSHRKAGRHAVSVVAVWACGLLSGRAESTDCWREGQGRRGGLTRCRRWRSQLPVAAGLAAAKTRRQGEGETRRFFRGCVVVGNVFLAANPVKTAEMSRVRAGRSRRDGRGGSGRFARCRGAIHGRPRAFGRPG